MKPLQFVPPEEAARANLYGLVAQLFYRAPDSHLIAELLQAEDFADDESALGARWRELIEACRAAFPAVLEQEHTDLFVGAGKAEVTPYLSHYVLKHSNDTPLVALRAQLLEWDISRQQGVPEYEDHITAVCETMRFLIAVQQRSAEDQKLFFERFLYRGASAFCDAVSASPNARFYRSVARFARTFLDIEREAFEYTASAS